MGFSTNFSGILDRFFKKHKSSVLPFLYHPAVIEAKALEETTSSEEKIKIRKKGIRNLNAKIPGASNFRYREFIKSDTAIRRGIDNTPTEAYWRNIERLAVNVLQPARKNSGRIRITSGYRSSALNKAIKGSETSLHCFGCAADIEPLIVSVSLLDLLEWIYNNCEFRELIAEFFDQDGWVHVGYVKGRNAKKLKLKDKDHNYKLVSLDYIKNLYK